jgi:lipopolysaccharide transport system ATP-binding protein
MSDTVIKVENLSKQYRLGQVSTGVLAHDVNRWWYKVRGKEDPYLKIGEVNDRTQKGNSDYVWALSDIDFDVKQGEVMGIIGRNGAGKSTLLKILSRTTAPTTGSVKIKGRVASLLEVGTGFHPELSGKENIFLNGAILGMTKKEIKRKFDEIVDFAGIERYIDTPVKRYSSGMYVRLAFAVAAHLESEILIVDEVLAVGDFEFQKKCLGKMGEVSAKEGRTVLFVSHNMPIMQKLCSHGLLMKNGKLLYDDQMSYVLDRYMESDQKEASLSFSEQPELEACLLKAEIRDDKDMPVSEIPIGRKWKVVVHFKVNQPILRFVSAIGLVSMHDVSIKSSWQKAMDVNEGIYEAVFEEQLIDYAVGQYKICIGLSQGKRSIQYMENILSFDIIPVVDTMDESVVVYESHSGLIINQMNTHTKKI